MGSLFQLLHIYYKREPFWPVNATPSFYLLISIVFFQKTRMMILFEISIHSVPGPIRAQPMEIL